ncbi:MAG: putative rRNA maturation factor [Clostridiales bacterium]|jgi:probable rRNA maturation factor|nr:putative rRNA maturation factor [Clostridiales bacterium]
MSVKFHNQQSKYRVKEWKTLINELAETVLSNESVSSEWLKQGLDLVVEVSFVGPVVIRRVNKEYRDVDQTTDVLSFPMLDLQDGQFKSDLTDSDFEITADGKRKLLLGDILLNLHRAYQQAEEYGHSLEREIAFLFVHSLLHLLGYDHMDEQRERIMIARQKEIMSMLGISR